MVPFLANNMIQTFSQRRISLFQHTCVHLFFACLALIGIRQDSLSQTDPDQFEEASPAFPSALGYGMLQDHYGFIWIVTYQQCFKYDGYTYSRLYGGTTLFPGGVNIHGIAGGRHEFVCVYAIANSLFLYNIDRNIGRMINLTRPAPPRYGWLGCVTEDSSGRFWIGCENGEVLRLNPHDSGFVTVLGCTDTTNTLPSVTAIAEDSSGNIWIGTEGGLLRIRAAAASSENLPVPFDTVHGLPAAGIVGLLPGRDGRLWVGMRDGSFGWIERWKMEFQRLASLPLPGGPFGVFALLAEDHSGDLWVGTLGNGLCRWDNDGREWQKYLVHREKSGHEYADVIPSIMVDRSGILWVLTNSRGLLRWISPVRAFHSFTAAENSRPRLSGSDVLCCWLDKSGTLWVGRGSGGLDYLKGGEKSFRRFVHDPADPQSLSHNFINSICERRNGEIWFGTAGGGINVLKRNAQAFSHIIHDPHDTTSLGYDIITSLYEDSRSGVWVGHFLGVDRFDPVTKIFVPVLRWPEETLGLVGSVTSFLEDDRGNLWMGTADRGLIRINLPNGDTVRYLRDPEKVGSLPGNNISTVHQDREGRLWIATTGGIARFDYASERFETYELRIPRRLRILNPQVPTPSDMQGVGSVVSDRRGNLWLSLSEGGVARFDVQHRLLRRYGEADGVVVRDGKRRGLFITPEGVIYLGGTGGITWFHPDSIDDSGFQAQVAITQFRVLQEPRLVPPAGSEPVELGYSANTFTFEFAMLDYRNPAENQCSYMLEGADTGWVFPGRERTVTYANVPPGEYRFRVRGENGGGVSSANEATVAIIVGRPYWQTWWFRSLILLFVSGMLYSFYRYRLSKLRELQHLRLRIADDLHDDVGSELSGIAIESDLIARQLLPESHERTRVVNVGRSIRRASDNLRDAVWIVNPDLDRIPDLVVRLQSIAGKMLAGHRLTFESSGVAPQLSLDMEFKRQILMVFKEMLNNILRHARASHVHVDVDLHGTLLRLQVSDDGVGFEEKTSASGVGLASMRNRAAAVGGKLTVKSALGAGTTVCLEADIIHSND
jgi:ligand-binding sensor domain-containing protein